MNPRQSGRAAAARLGDLGGEGVVVGDLLARAHGAQRDDLRPAAALGIDAHLDLGVRVARVIDPARLIDHVEEVAVAHDERVAIVDGLLLVPQDAVDVGDDLALREVAGRDDAVAVDGGADDAQSA